MNQLRDHATCINHVNAVRDALYTVNGKWKLLVVAALYDGPKRFNDIKQEVEGITPRMLTKELRDLELNAFVERKIEEGAITKITYSLTPYSSSLRNIISALVEFGNSHKHYLQQKYKTEKEGKKKPVYETVGDRD